MAKETSKVVGTAETAETKAEVAQEQATKKEQKTLQESVYPASELAANAFCHPSMRLYSFPRTYLLIPGGSISPAFLLSPP